MKENQLLVMTSFGPVPYDAVKEYLNKEVTKVIDANRNKLCKEEVPIDQGYYVMKLAEKQGWHPEKMKHYLQKLLNMNLVAGFLVLLREVAIELDKKYPDHINKCEEFYIISTLDGRIHKTCRAHAKNFRNFAAFRTEEDARTACRILRNILKKMFESEKK